MTSSKIVSNLISIDPAFISVTTKFPDYPLLNPPEPNLDIFKSLVKTIVGQQLSGKAAATINSRLELQFQLTPQALSKASVADLKSVGISAAKARSIKELSEQINSGLVDLTELPKLSEVEIRSQLLKIWGIGNWTVDMFLMFDLRQPDIWPINDLGVQKGWQVLHELSFRPNPKQLAKAGDALVGMRSAAAWYCWRALD